MPKTPFLWTNDDLTVGQADKLKLQTDFLAEFGIPGTFFVIPVHGGKTIADDPELIKAIEDARAQGHEFVQHGTRHDAFECGVPETWMLDFSPPTRRRYDEQRLEIEKQHTLEAQVRTIEEGRAVWRKAFGEDSPGFRSGWGAFCGAFYQALDVLGFTWVSSRIVCPTSWVWNQGMWDVDDPFRECIPWAPYQIEGTSVWEIPMTGGDYAFNVPNEADKIDAMAGLAAREFDFCVEQGVPFCMVCHWHGLGRNDNAGYAVHRKLLARMCDGGEADFITMSDVQLGDA